MKHLTKIFSVGLASLSLTPTLTSFSNVSNSTTILLNNNTSKNIEEKDLRCTVAYVGKKLTKDGIAIIARSNDATTAGNFYLKKVKRNELANVTIKNDFGFKYTFPNKTYEFISSPDSFKNAPKEERHLWQNMGINEMGVAITCTLTCAANEKATATDPHLETGVAEEVFNQILAASATSARNAMEITAQIIDQYGSQDANLIMATDQNETWLMELYTGHEYCAVKLPDDKAMIAGNEFILDSLYDLGITEDNKENCILSKTLLSRAVDNGFAQWIDGTTEQTKDVYHLNLFNTYGGESTTERFRDSCHMRTWREYSLWDPSNTQYQIYEPQKKYPAFLVPKDAKGTVRNDMTIYDVIKVYRDEYDEIINNEDNPNHTYFQNLKDQGKLRAIAAETAGLVHILTANPNLPKEIAVNALYCPSSANYTPFILLNNGINSFDGEYAYCPERWCYDEKCSSVLFRKLNSLTWPHRIKYGYPLQDFWSAHENIYITQMQQVINDASKLSSLEQTRQVLTNFNKHLRETYIETIKYVTDDLIWHDMDQDHRSEEKINAFVPLVDMQQYLTQLGWTDFKQDGNIITFKYNNVVGKLEINEGYQHEKGLLTIDNVNYEILINYKNQKPYVGFRTLTSAIGNNKKVIDININDYLDPVTKSNKNLALILSLSIGLPILAGVAIAVSLIMIKKKKNSNLQK